MDKKDRLIVEIITGFLNRIGIPFSLRTIQQATVLPGLLLQQGTLIIDPEKLIYPGDILHEAGHVAVVAPEVRETMSGNLPDNDTHRGGEMMAMAWSYAACLHLGLPAEVVFLEAGYRGGGTRILETYLTGQGIGVPGLQWLGMAFDNKNAEKLNTLAFPNMISWVRKA